LNAEAQFGYAIRPATASDAPALGLLFAAHLQALGATPDAELDADMANYRVVYHGAANGLLVAESDAEGVVGMGGVADGVIRRLHVSEKWRGHGIARALVMRLIALHCSVSSQPLTALVAGWNVPARRLFQACGFQPTGRFPQHPKMSGCEILSFVGSCPPLRCV
jgi:GNAT superfamily N-acetyltransferase